MSETWASALRFAGLIAAAALLIYVAVLALIWSQQRRMLFPASPLRTNVVESGLVGFEDVAIRTEDGETLMGWWKPPQPGRVLLLYFHGNGGSLLNRRDRARLLTQDGRGLLLVSYRGYSGSTGSPSEAGLRSDARAAYRWLASYEPRRIVLYGESLGTGVAVRLATEAPVGGVILDAPYTSTADIAKSLFPYLPVALLMRDQFRSVDRIARLHLPLLIMHGDRDGVVPIALSQTLFERANEPKHYVRLPGVEHEGVLEGGGLREVRRFLDEIEAGLARAQLPRPAE